ncbi:flavin-dependent thymidylate synthase [Streptomyces asoensis]|uniref:Flavin-dependent thymidylate synthase n=3 Tax=Streptomyces TaxID=1883 RepID=C1IC19_9ACTN|nr:thymidylate synthase [Streptomyces asoensis]AFP55303.1 thymidylate synthase ThyX [Streptomyces aureochromogenes]GGQ54443.1 flavin-dependent thymidylate synthase [Streptomyces asoensis]GHI60753.1 flavin-dependent thymidylate synthase [Streptomyces asoensis]
MTEFPAAAATADAGRVGVMESPRIELRSDITVELVDSSASDLAVVKAARVSTAGEDANDELYDGGSTRGLIRYLMRSRHGSPFEHNSMTFLVRAPIFTVRHLMRHRTWSFNEESARYREVGAAFYVPDATRLLRQEGKPGDYRYVGGSTDDHQQVVRSATRAYEVAFEEYQRLLDSGIAREIARLVLPVSTYSVLYATCNARALMHFLSLRTHRPDAAYVSHPQREIEMVAEQMETAWAKLMPVTHEAFTAFGRVSP